MRTEPKFSYFELQAYWGVSKPHMGGLKATKELIELCDINKGNYVLDVGCGAGVTPCYIAKKYGCKVIGVDISKSFLSKAKERAKREHVEDKVKFKVADAQNLPFKNAVFDAVICESVNAFVKNKQKAIKEYVRVIKPGGYVGINEATWIKKPTAEFAEYITRITCAKFENSDSWKKLLRDSGLKNIGVKTYKINAISQFIDEIRYIGLRDFVKGLYRFRLLYIKSSAFRKYLKEAWPPKSIFKNYYKYLGYGLYVGRK